MGQRLPSLSTHGLDVAAQGYDKYVQAAQISASGDMALAHGIAQGIAMATTAQLRKRETAREDSIRAEAYARQDARDAKADSRYDRSEARDMEKEQRQRDEVMLRYTEGKKAELAERMRAGDMTAESEWMANEQTAKSLTQRLMGSSGQRLTPQPDTQGGATDGSTSKMWEQFVAIDKAEMDKQGYRAPTATPATSAGLDLSGATNLPPKVCADGHCDAPTLSSATSAAVAQRDALVKQHAGAVATVESMETDLAKANKRLSSAKTPVGIAATQAEIRDLTTRLQSAKEKVAVVGAHANDAAKIAGAEVSRDIEAAKHQTTVARNIDEFKARLSASGMTMEDGELMGHMAAIANGATPSEVLADARRRRGGDAAAEKRNGKGVADETKQRGEFALLRGYIGDKAIPAEKMAAMEAAIRAGQPAEAAWKSSGLGEKPAKLEAPEEDSFKATLAATEAEAKSAAEALAEFRRTHKQGEDGGYTGKDAKAYFDLTWKHDNAQEAVVYQKKRRAAMIADWEKLTDEEKAKVRAGRR